MDTNTPNTRLTKIDDHTIDHSRCSVETLDKAAGRTFRHYLRNEIDAKVLSWAESDAGKAAGAGSGDTDSLTDAQKAIRLAKRNEFRDAAVTKLYDGTWASEVRGTGEGRQSPLEAKIRSMCWDDLSNKLLANGYVLPTPKKPTVIKGYTEPQTKDMLINRQLVEYKKYDEYKAKAAAAIAAAEKAKAKAIEKAKGSEVEF